MATEGENKMIQIIKDLRDKGISCKEVEQTMEKKGFVRPGTKKPYGQATLCSMLLKAHPESRRVKEYTKPGRSGGKVGSNGVDKLKIIATIMNSQDLSKQEKLEVLKGIIK